jgi:hypothetical protein
MPGKTGSFMHSNVLWTSGKIRTLDEAKLREGEVGWRRKIQPTSLTRRRSRSI